MSAIFSLQGSRFQHFNFSFLLLRMQTRLFFFILYQTLLSATHSQEISHFCEDTFNISQLNYSRTNLPWIKTVKNRVVIFMLQQHPLATKLKSSKPTIAIWKMPRDKYPTILWRLWLRLWLQKYYSQGQGTPSVEVLCVFAWVAEFRFPCFLHLFFPVLTPVHTVFNVSLQPEVCYAQTLVLNYHTLPLPENPHSYVVNYSTLKTSVKFS